MSSSTLSRKPRIRATGDVANLWRDTNPESPSFEVYFFVVKKPKRIQESLGTTDLEEAIAALAKKRAPGVVLSVEDRNIRMNEAMENVFTLRENKRSRRPLKKRGGTKYRQDWKNHAQDLLGHLKVRDVTWQHIVLVRDAAEAKGLSERSVENVLIMLSSCMTYMTKTPFSYRADNPCKNLGEAAPKRTSGQSRKVETSMIFTEDEMVRLVDAVADTPNQMVYKTIIWLAHETGMRISELLGLCITDLDWNAREIFLQRQLANDDFRVADPTTWFEDLKGDGSRVGHKKRYLPLSDFAVALLREYVTWAEDRGRLLFGGMLFCTAKHTPIRQGPVERAFNAAVEAAKIGREMDFHYLRHTFASNQFAGGASMSDVQRLLGHASIKTTQDTYVHLEDRAKFNREVAARGRAAQDKPILTLVKEAS